MSSDFCYADCYTPAVFFLRRAGRLLIILTHETYPDTAWAKGPLRAGFRIRLRNDTLDHAVYPDNTFVALFDPRGDDADLSKATVDPHWQGLLAHEIFDICHPVLGIMVAIKNDPRLTVPAAFSPRALVVVDALVKGWERARPNSKRSLKITSMMVEGSSFRSLDFIYRSTFVRVVIPRLLKRGAFKKALGFFSYSTLWKSFLEPFRRHGLFFDDRMMNALLAILEDLCMSFVENRRVGLGQIEVELLESEVSVTEVMQML